MRKEKELYTENEIVEEIITASMKSGGMIKALGSLELAKGYFFAKMSLTLKELEKNHQTKKTKKKAVKL